jgi:hypothetical protein
MSDKKLSFFVLALSVLCLVATNAQAYWCEDWDKIWVEVEGTTIRLFHEGAFYNCCPERFDFEVEFLGDVIVVTEIEILVEPCACMCCYNLSTSIEDVPPGTYTLVLRYGNQEWSTTVTIPVRGQGQSRWINLVEWSECIMAPPISSLSATGGPSQIDLAWEFEHEADVEFRIERSPDGLDPWSEIASVPLGGTSYTDTDVEQDTTYYYRMRTFDTMYGEYSPYTDTVSASTMKPVTLLLTGESNDGVILTWEGSSSLTYDLLKGTAPDALVLIGSVPGRDGLTTVRDTASDKLVFYRIAGR